MPEWIAVTASACCLVELSISPQERSESSSVSSVWYRISFSAVCEAKAGAVFALAVSIACELLSAELTGQFVVGFPDDQPLMRIPPCIPAPVGAEVFHFSSDRLYDLLPAAFTASCLLRRQRMTAEIGADGVYRDPHPCSNTRGRDASGIHQFQERFLLFCHYCSPFWGY